MSIQYVHTNIIAKNWRQLADFYIRVFNCRPLDPERDLAGEWIDKLTAIDNVRVRGIHLRLPGYENGPTLEIFQYEPEQTKDLPPAINRQGLGHLAFHVDDVEMVLADLVAHGGRQLGALIEKRYDSLGLLTAVYAADPEGNFIEIQNWRK